MRRAALALAILTGAPASAAPALPDGLRLAVTDGTLVVRQQKVHAALDVRAETIGRVRFDPARKTVAVRILCEFCCDAGWHERTFTVDQLHARLEHVRGQRLFKRKDHTGAEKLFARAAALDGGLEAAVIDRARALVRGGKQTDAAAALEPLIKKDALALYARVLSTKDLRPLRDEPRLRALRPAKPGSASWPPRKLDMIAVQREQGLIAVGSTWTSSYADEHYHTDLRIFELHSGKLRATLPIWHGQLPGNYGRALARLAGPAQTLLRDWGFQPARGAMRSEPETASSSDGNTEIFKVQFKGSRIGLVTRRGEAKVRLISKNTVLREVRVGGNTLAGPAYLLPDVSAVVFFTEYISPGDCDPCETEIGVGYVVPLSPK
jgi:hypothetical protein